MQTNEQVHKYFSKAHAFIFATKVSLLLTHALSINEISGISDFPLISFFLI